ncbi:hypothetical protein AB4Z50_34880 [Paenibacillus sp. 2TAB26]|uniref:hypothetical protein n=1 Tax=Paenibacillus sp. 2TAB26 TaxID=3233005 RepID=UPI003F9E7970
MNRKSLLGAIISFSLIAVMSTVHDSNHTSQTSSNTNGEVIEPTASAYPTNDQGQTYGHGPFPEGVNQGPDLIKAEGKNGVVGYVKSTDLEPSMSSIEEALAYNKSMEKLGYVSLPLYETDGKTIIGEFIIYSSSNGDK